MLPDDLAQMQSPHSLESNTLEKSERFPHMVFIDTSIAGYEKLVEGVADDTEVVLIDSFFDLIQSLEGREIGSLDILSHGDTGEIHIGDEILSLGSMAQYSDVLEAINAAVVQGGDLRLYGCNIGESSEGLSFIEAIAAATGADVAASNDLTGASALGGDWDLEVQYGDVKTSSALSSESMASFRTVLAPTAGTEDFGSTLSILAADSLTPSTNVNGSGLTISWSADTDPDAQSDTYGELLIDAILYDPAHSFTTSIGNAGYGQDDSGDNSLILGNFTGGGSPGAESYLNYVSFESDNGTDTFDLDGFQVYYRATAALDFTVSAYDSSGAQIGSDVSIVSSSFTSTTDAGYVAGYLTITDSDLGSDFNDIVEFRITPSDSTKIAVLGVDDVVIADAITNVAPVLSGISATPSYVENGSAVILEAAATVSDSELDALNSSNGEYSGASLTIARNGGANAEDVFGFTDGSVSLDGSNLQSGGLTFATFSQSSGTLTVDFTSSGTTATAALVETVLQSITYSNSSNTPSSSVQLDWTFSDGTDSDTGSTTVSITATNDAPVLSTTDSPVLTAIDEEAGDDDGSGADGDDDVSNNTNNGGNTIASIVIDASVTDLDGSAVESIAVTAVDNTNGVWQFSTDSGTSWSDFSATTGTTVNIETAARLLQSTDMIRFVPDADYSGTATFSYRAWDESSGSAGDTADASVNGNATAFSTAEESASITVNDINDAPEFVALNGTPTFVEGGSAVVLDADVTVVDLELDALNSASGNYNGASLTISRNGGSSGDDVFSLSSGSLTESGNLTVASTDIGTVTTNSNGVLTLTFNLSATTALVNQTLQAINYENSSNAPDSSVVLDWTFNDGSTDSTGTNQTTVTISEPSSSGSGSGSSSSDSDTTSDDSDTTTVDGATLSTNTEQDNLGNTVERVTVSAITSDREDTDSTSTGADLPFQFLGSNTNNVVTTLSLPIGLGAQVLSNTTANSQNQADNLVNLISSADSSDDSLAAQTAGSSFLSDTSTSNTWVNSVTLTGSGSTGSSPVLITGTSDTTQREAVVIDTSSVSSGVHLQLDNIEFSYVVGSATITGGDGENYVHGDSRTQFIKLGAEDDELHGGGGNDMIGSEGGEDLLFGDSGDDTVFGGTGADSVSGGSGDDILQGAQLDNGTLSFSLNSDGVITTTYDADNFDSDDDTDDSTSFSGDWYSHMSFIVDGEVRQLLTSESNRDTIESYHKLLQANDDYAFLAVDSTRLKTLAILHKVFEGELYTVDAFNTDATSSKTLEAFAVDAVQQWQTDNGFTDEDSVETQVISLLDTFWRYLSITRDDIDAGVSFIEQGGSWEALMLDTIASDNSDYLLYGGEGHMQLVQTSSVSGSGLTTDASDDSLFGGEGNDTLIGGHGSDLLDGGDDTDTVVQARSSDDYDVMLNEDGQITLVYEDGVYVEEDILIDIELVSFSNLDMDFSASNLETSELSQLGALGQLMVGAAPTLELLNAYQEDTLSLEQLASELMNTDAYQTLWGDVSDEQFIAGLTALAEDQVFSDEDVSSWMDRFGTDLTRADVFVLASGVSDYQEQALQDGLLLM